MLETARVAMRNVRRETNEKLKKMEKDKALSKDDAFKLQEEVQKTTDRYIGMVESVYAEKEKEILEIYTAWSKEGEAAQARCNHHGRQREMGEKPGASESRRTHGRHRVRKGCGYHDEGVGHPLPDALRLFQRELDTAQGGGESLLASLPFISESELPLMMRKRTSDSGQ